MQERIEKTAELILEGMSACSGSEVGKAKVIINLKQDYKKFESGNILVVRQTTPEWFPLLVMSKAVIGEVGGICSHLATIARELNKPAIVAAKGATALIKDEDLIFVNATEGKVYKILT